MRMFLARRRGNAGSDYALAVGLIAVVALVAIAAVGGNMRQLFIRTSNVIGGVANITTTGGTTGGTAPDTAGTLTPGDTAKIVTRGDVQTRCSIWNGRRCNLPELNFTASSYYPGDPNRTQWARPYDATNFPSPLCGLFCALSTGNPAYNHCQGTDTGITTHNYRLIDVTSPVCNTRVQSTITHDAQSFSACIQPTNNLVFHQIDCAGW